ncbi:MAG: hypothetical protein WDL87_08615 [Candidatus Omnitrophota bacterium]
MFFHNAMYSVDSAGIFFAIFQICPDAPVSPEGMVGFDGQDAGE